MEIASIVKALTPAALSFFIGISLTPFLTYYLYKYQMWKKQNGKLATDGSEATIFSTLHQGKQVGTPKLGGTIIWLSVFLGTIIIWLTARAFPEYFGRLDFLSRSQTWIPLAVLLLGAFVGAIDDLLEVSGKGGHIAGGLSLSKRLTIVAVIGVLCATWFYGKLGIAAFNLPYGYELYLGPIFIFVFAFITLFIYSGGVIDGLDGLSGGVFGVIYACYGVLAFFQDQIDVAALCAAIVGGILAFLWFNIPPARFYMSETGSMALTVTLPVIALMTDQIGDGYGMIILPLIALPLVLTSLSDIIQIGSKKLRGGKKVFLVAPLHHHFEAIGWPSYKVTMRYWIISIIFGAIGVIIALL